MSQSGAGSVDYRGSTANTSRSPSGAIWSRVSWNELQAGTLPGVAHFDDFNNYPLIGTQTTEIAHGQYKVFATSGGSVTSVSAVNSVELPGGYLQLGSDTDNESATIADAYPYLLMDGVKTYTQRICFEARIAMSSILTATSGVFLGLAEVDAWTLATGVPFTGTGDAITNAASAIGFLKGEDALGVVNTVVSDRATSFTNIQAAAATISAANTFIKLGFVYDIGKSADCVTFFADGVPCSTYYTSTALLATTNLKANALGRILSTHSAASGTATKTYCDWWKVSAEFNF